ncbi:PadR family transcriptional regulator [Kineothrix sp. MB12-C1]|uniref:PadR family transcriptional regulator n=1 Tax=Kineothrix sp. MB12-C1 TaxID=3070215 RepID=UPI0027D23712|nr:PadR family transcriptional regulator [Kineothrix sp. MB12-C1]WMC92174.1 PadR family transcriptional regulator [Kineothrix sp. MB12-C1]
MEELNEILSSLTLELRRGTIVLSVLSQLSKPQYGYTLVKAMEDKGVPIDTNTLYPLLRRLEKQGLLISEWETDGSKPRKYYRRTILGDAVYDRLVKQWREMTESMNHLLEQGV